MHYRRLGHSGLKVSELSLGAWITFGAQIEDKVANALLHRAFDLGVNFFDNADQYAGGEAEKTMAKAIKDLPRQALVISSKVFWPTMPGINGRGLSRKHITESIHASLKRLDTDYVDLYFCHRFDPDTPVEEVVFTMNTLIQQGKALYWGTSEWRASQIAQAHGLARQYGLIPPSMEQPKYNMLHRRRVEHELAAICSELGIGLTTFSPLAAGILTGKYNKGIPQGSRATLEGMGWVTDRLREDGLKRIEQLVGLAAELGISPAQLAIAWILRRKEVSSVITGASSLAQLEDNLGAVDAAEKLDDAALERIEKILDNLPGDE
ncbi:MAG: aldo/keto reductase [Anaerolineales bacterium]